MGGLGGSTRWDNALEGLTCRRPCQSLSTSPKITSHFRPRNFLEWKKPGLHFKDVERLLLKCNYSMQGIAMIRVCFPVRSLFWLLLVYDLAQHPKMSNRTRKFHHAWSPQNTWIHVPDHWKNESLGLSSHQGQSQNSVPAPRPQPKARSWRHPSTSWRQNNCHMVKGVQTT